MEDIYKTWVNEAGVDGFRIDTVKHVNMEFWQQFGPALQGYAATQGNDDFFMFGEVFDTNPEFMSRYTTARTSAGDGRLRVPGQRHRLRQGPAGAGSSARKLQQFFASDDWYTDTDSNAYSLPTFLGNHDMGRIGKFLADTGATGDTLLQRDQFAHALMYTTRGQPVVYYGDEQGFTGDGGDQDARQDMFASKVASYNDDDLIGTSSTTAVANYDTRHPLYGSIRALSDLRKQHPTLADGAQVHRYADDGPGIYAFSRISAGKNVEYVVAANSADQTKSATFPTYSSKQTFTKVWPRPGTGGNQSSVKSGNDKQLGVTVPARSVVVYRATKALGADSLAPQPSIASPAPGAVLEGRTPVGVDLPRDDFQQATVAWRPVGGTAWTRLGTDDNAPYRVFHDVSGLAKGSIIEYRVVVRDHDGDLGVASTLGRGRQGAGRRPTGRRRCRSLPTCPSPAATAPSSAARTAPPTAGPSRATGTRPARRRSSTSTPTTRSGRAPGRRPRAATRSRPPSTRPGTRTTASAASPPVRTSGYTTDGEPGPLLLRPPHALGDQRPDQRHRRRDRQLPERDGLRRPTTTPTCMRAWLQDPDGNMVYSLGVTNIPAGTYTVQAVKNGGAPGTQQSFTVDPGEVTTFTFDAATSALTVSTTPPG